MSIVPEDVEVRRCRKCDAVAVLPGIAWQQRTMGISLPSATRDYRCQACGAKFKIRPRTELLGMAIAGVLLLCTPMGVIFLVMAYVRSKQDEWNPIVPGAPVPERRYWVGPPLRRCAECGATVEPSKVTKNRVNGIPVGVTSEYDCSECGAHFTIESFGAQAMNVLSGLVVGGIGALFLTLAETPGWKWGGSIVCALLMLLMFGLVTARFIARMRNPAIPWTGPS